MAESERAIILYMSTKEAKMVFECIKDKKELFGVSEPLNRTIEGFGA